MKRISHIAIALLALVALPVSAANINVTPTSVSTVAGQTFTMNIAVNAEGSDVTTVKSELTYPGTLLEVTGFTFASGWMQLSQPGYDSVTNGSLIKTAGFPGGFTGTKTFGTVTFRAKAAGTANITVANSSLILSKGGQSVLSSMSGGVATISPNTVNTPNTDNGVISNPDTSVSSDDEVTDGLDNGTETATATTESVNNDQAAAAAATGDAVGSEGWKWALLVLVIIGAGYWAYSRFGSRA